MSLPTRICFLVFVVFETIHASEWHYDPDTHDRDPIEWASLPNAVCTGNSQSPVDIPVVTDVGYRAMNTFMLSGFNNPSSYETTLKNNGHTLQVDIAGDLTVKGGGLGGTFKAAQLHFHWGNADDHGSEHKYGGRVYPMEMHVVTYNTKYPNIGVAIDKDDGLAVLGFWIVTTSSTNTAFNPIVNHIVNVSNADTNVKINLDVDALFPTDMASFFRYKGSLTTPPCFESVTWTMFESKILISRQQLAMFRTVSGDHTGHGHPIIDNFRATKPLNGRAVARSFKLQKEINSASAVTSLSIVFYFIFALFHSLFC